MKEITGYKKKFFRSLMVCVIWCAGSMLVHTQTSISNCVIDVSKPGAKVAAVCRGQQIEEFNHQIEGGLYAQLIHNPSFEELKNPIAEWFIVKSGSLKGIISSQSFSETEMLNNRQAKCIRFEILSAEPGKIGLANGGYWGIKLENKTKYKVSFWAKCDPEYKGTIKTVLESKDGKVYAQSSDFKPTTNWQHFTCDLVTEGVLKITGGNRFVIYASTPGSLFFDVVTVMPPTWKNRPNGLRPDLAEMLNALKINYLHFPGGCTAESAGMDSCWNWKNSIGPLEERPGSTRNRWYYKNDLYFGLDEHLQLCEDLGAEPVYVTSAGISETPRSKRWFAYCPLEKMQPLVQDVLDLLEYCNGSTSTPWGAKRAANGHPDSYNLKYIEIGSENGYETEKEYGPRYKMIRDAIKARYPDIMIMYNGFRWASYNQDLVFLADENALTHDLTLSRTNGNSVDFADEHFYFKDLSILYNKFDKIDPTCKMICVGEFASSVKGNGGDVIGNFGDALADAAFMLGCEKNSERIWWTGYGNYAGHVGHSNFGPCIVWNDAVSCFASPSYYMQKMFFTENMGTRILPFTPNASKCFWSASVNLDGGKREIIIKVVNKESTPETVKITLNGASKVNSKGRSYSMSGAPEDENSLAEPTKLVPTSSSFSAGNVFNYTFPGCSATVLRIGY
jgi:alpha-L-arabinofuranosidase